MKLRKTSAGILRNEAETKYEDRLARTQEALTRGALKSIRANPVGYDGWSKARQN